jgi:hypothetical protein
MLLSISLRAHQQLQASRGLLQQSSIETEKMAHNYELLCRFPATKATQLDSTIINGTIEFPLPGNDGRKHQHNYRKVCNDALALDELCNILSNTARQVAFASLRGISQVRWQCFDGRKYQDQL